MVPAFLLGSLGPLLLFPAVPAFTCPQHELERESKGWVQAEDCPRALGELPSDLNSCLYLGQWFTDINVRQNHLEDSLNHRLLGLTRSF